MSNTLHEEVEAKPEEDGMGVDAHVGAERGQVRASLGDGSAQGHHHARAPPPSRHSATPSHFSNAPIINDDAIAKSFCRHPDLPTPAISGPASISSSSASQYHNETSTPLPGVDPCTWRRLPSLVGAPTSPVRLWPWSSAIRLPHRQEFDG